MFQWRSPPRHVRLHEPLFNFLKSCYFYVHVVSIFYTYPHITIKYFIMELCDVFPLRVCFLAILK
jgi:hypothetical protein